MHPQRSIPMKIPKISHCGSRSPKYIELDYFTLLFCRGRQRNVLELELYFYLNTVDLSHKIIKIITIYFNLHKHDLKI